MVEELYSVKPSSGQVAFIYLGYSGVILRTENFAIGVDVADRLGESDIQDIAKLDLLIYTHAHGDHFNMVVAQGVYEKTGCFIAAEHAVYETLSNKVPAEKIFELQEGVVKTFDFQGGRVTIYPVYGVHPVQIIAFTMDVDGLRIFHGGDSGYPPVNE